MSSSLTKSQNKSTKPSFGFAFPSNTKHC